MFLKEDPKVVFASGPQNLDLPLILTTSVPAFSNRSELLLSVDVDTGYVLVVLSEGMEVIPWE